MTANILWLTEFLLESLGAWLCFRKFAGGRADSPKASQSRTAKTSPAIQPLGIYLAFRALADAATFAVLISAGQSAYYWADFWLRTVAYILFWILAMFTVAKVLREDKHTAVFYLGMTLIFGAFAVVCFHAQPLTMHRVWRFEIWADIVAGALVCMAMGTQEWAGRTVPKLWAMVSLGIFVQSASDGILAAGQYHGRDVAAYYPLGAILALGIWVWGVRKEAKHGMDNLNRVRSADDSGGIDLNRVMEIAEARLPLSPNVLADEILRGTE